MKSEQHRYELVGTDPYWIVNVEDSRFNPVFVIQGHDGAHARSILARLNAGSARRSRMPQAGAKVPVTAPTPLQVWSAAFGDLVHDARAALGRDEWDTLLSIVAARIAREVAGMLDHEERPE